MNQRTTKNYSSTTKRTHSSPPWLLLFLCMLLWGIVPNTAYAKYDLNWDDISVTWNQSRGSFDFSCTLVEYDDWNEAIQNMNIKMNGTTVAYLTGTYSSDGNVYIENKYSQQSLYISTGGWSQLSNGSGKWLGNGNRSITFSIYPHNTSFINNYVSVTCYWDVDVNAWSDHSQGEYSEWSGTTTLYTYTPSLSSWSHNTDDGTFSYKIACSNLDKYSYNSSSTALYYYTSESSNTAYTYSTATLNNSTQSISYSSKELLDKATSDQQFANGLWFKLYSTTDPDSGSGSYYCTSLLSSAQHTGYTAVMKDNSFKVTQSNRNINLTWSVLQPTGNPSSQDMANFAVERKVNGVWVEIDEVTFSTNKTDYSYTYTLPESECIKGEVDYIFRVWKKRYASQGIYSERMSSEEVTTKIYTDYKKPMLTMIDPDEEKSQATLTWSLDGNGIWNDDIELTINVYNSTLGTWNSSVSVGYSNTSAIVPSLLGCNNYDISLSVTVLGSTYYTTETISELIPDNQARTISSFEASKGYYNTYTRLTWEVPADSTDFDYFDITRRNMETNETVSVTQVTHVGLTSYSLQDEGMDTGVMYEYVVNGYSSCDNVPAIGSSASSIGFSQPYATASGRISYDGNQGVPNVAVSIVGNDATSSNKSVYFDGQGTSSTISLPYGILAFDTNTTYSLQAWINPRTQSSTGPLISKGDIFTISLVENNDDESASLKISLLGSTRTYTDISFIHDTWKHLTAVVEMSSNYSEATVTLYINGELANTYTFTDLYSAYVTLQAGTAVMLGTTSIGGNFFKGNIDEVRLWTIALDSAAVAQNFDTFLTGKETSLSSYYRCDESGSSELFDLSAVGSSFNKNDGIIGNTVTHSTFTPSSEQLSIKGTTDSDGNYLINTVPYTSDGLQYNIVPTYGVHEFSPNKQPIYVSPSSVVFNNINFDDISSFPVSGVVYYDGTDYPVEGASLYVDGVICSNNGKLITTASDGTFEISVPIGDHYISVEMTEHTFTNEGRYPTDEDNVGTTYTFEQEITNLTFYDNTLVPIIGRVAGGEVEAEKTVGFGLSNNNIGMATLKLSSGNYRMNVIAEQVGTVVSYVENPDDVAIESPTGSVSSSSYRAGGNDEDVRYIYITTDSITGEFAALVPPLAYTIEDVVVNNNSAIAFSNLSTIDASNVSLTYTDTITNDNGIVESLTYNASTILQYRNTPTFTVTDNSNIYGAYGESTYNYSDLIVSETLDVYSIDNDTKAVTYNYGYPIFVKNNTYSFLLEGYEEYYNYDVDMDNPTIDKVPIDGSIVTITNELSSSQSVYLEDGTTEEGVDVETGDIVSLEINQLELDSLGQATYEWEAGFPNITAPYTRGLSIVYTNNGQQLQWSGNTTFEAVVLGELPSGSNFITSGPDKVLMILRDPPGSNSNAYWESGTTITTETTNSAGSIANAGVTTTTSFGAVTYTIVGTPVTGTIAEAGIENTLEVGVEVNTTYTSSNTTSTTITTTKQISTSDSEDYVGDKGDVFIGTATNLLFGNARNVGFARDTDTGLFSLTQEDVVTIGSEFSTAFNYTQNYVEEVLIPNLYLTRNSYLQTVSDSELSNFVNNTEGYVYLTTLSDDDERFGTSNTDADVWGSLANTDNTVDLLSGPSYTIVPPVTLSEDSVYQDMVVWHNEQIASWIETLASNEKAKVTAINARTTYLSENLSFDQGTSIESSVSSCINETSAEEWEVETILLGGFDAGFEVNGNGLRVETTVNVGGVAGGSSSESTETCSTTGFSLADDGLNDALSVDVMDAPDGFGAIFVTRGGQTSCPYEDAVYTKYYEPNTEISTATMQVEIPVLEADNYYATDIPSGGTATYSLEMRNDSETGDDVWFDLKVVDATNTNGASLSMDGSKLTEEGRGILVAAGSSLVKSLQLTQTEIDVLEYNNIAVVLVSQCQNDPTGLFPVISDTVYLSAQFVPSCSDITLKIDETTMNMFTSDTLTLEMSDFDRTFNSFETIRIQYKYANDVSWTLGKEYVLDEADVTNSTELLPDGGIITVQFPMSNTATFPDGTYQFRLQTTCMFGTEGVYTESETITVIKDMEAPQALGTPEPSDGILSAGDDISVSFNENIRNGSLTDAANFLITGVLNDAVISHDVTLALTGTTTAVAATEADVHLANSSFAMDMWINYTEAGTVVEHGSADNKFIVEINDAGKLVVTIAGESYTSEGVIPTDTWCYLTLNYTDTEYNLLTATVAYDASTIELFNSVVVPDYTGTGILGFGKGVVGSMHEITLWNYARTTTDAQSEMYVGKSAATPNLIGYWKLDEGHGTSAVDAARSRHLTLAAESWALNNENLSVYLDGSAYLSLDITTTSANNTDSYMYEMWFKGGAQTDATLWSANDHNVGMKFNDSGLLTLMLEGEETLISSTNYLDDAWHHVALNVLRNGTASVYVDGTAVKQLSASLVPALQSDALFIGVNRSRITTLEGGYAYSSYFTGEVDEIRYWSATVNGEFIVNNMYNRVNASDVAGLVGYYPFEETGLDSYNQVITSFTLADFSDSNLGNATIVNAVEGTTAPALQEAPSLTNISFSYVASEREIVIDILEDAYRIEGTTLNFTVQNVRDDNDNLIQPISWSAYVNCNRLVWDESEVSYEVANGESYTFTTTISNQGSDGENWTITNLPTWLSASQTAGYLAPLSSDKVTFTISAAASIGTYEEEVYLSGNDAIYTPMTLGLKVVAEAPAWSVNPGDFESNMNIVGQVSILDAISYDADDIVAAFNGETCVGLASPQYYSRYDAYFTVMTVYGNAEDSGTAITFKIWDASTGTTYPAVTTSQEVTFIANNLLGGYTTPFTWNAEDYIEQSTAMTTGWNWISLSVDPQSKAIGDVFTTINDNGYIAKGHDSFSEMANGSWSGTLSTLELGKMYRVQMNASDMLEITGSIVDQTSTSIDIATGWNWLGYTAMYSLGIDEAFAEVDPQTGDVMKSLTGFAIYQDYEWVGTLTALQPGEGYMYYNSTSTAKEFNYPSSSIYGSTSLKAATPRANSSYNTVDQGLYSSNMTMVAVVQNGADVASGADVGVFAGTECRAAQVADATGIVYLTVLGDGVGDELTFHITYGGKEYEIDQELLFFDNQHYGSVDEPYVIQLDPSYNGIMNSSNDAFAVYLDPATDKAHIETSMTFVSAKVCNMLGATLYESDNTTVIDFAGFFDGVYFVILTDEEGNMYIERVVKN